MIKYAQISITNGEVLNVINIHSSYAYGDGKIIEGVLFKELSEDVDEKTFAKTNYWKDEEWHTREAKPGRHYFWENYAWVKDLTPFWDMIRGERDTLLSMSDWTQISDNSLSEELKESWRVYRQSLREITTTYSSAEDEEEITWPTKPS